ncbi:MAG: hypothetical protein J5554_03840 [Paludibacteraceae bacterium]|nr:hypothetical protein [Paludibacteraceae bacterium]
MKKFVNLIFGVLFFCLCSCATGSVLVTGTKRTPINPSNVVLYTEAPLKYEVIGIVTASCGDGFSEQDDMDMAVAKLKEKAASVGANGVIVETVGTSKSGYVSNGFYIPTSEKNISGKAIYVFGENTTQP